MRSHCAGWRNVWRRCGFRTRSGRSSCRALPRGSTYYSVSVTRLTGSPSPSTGPSDPRQWWSPYSTGSPDWGETRRKALVSHFGSVRALRKATVEDIVEIPGFGPKLAGEVVAALSKDKPGEAINTATGEVADADGLADADNSTTLEP